VVVCSGAVVVCTVFVAVVTGALAADVAGGTFVACAGTVTLAGATVVVGAAVVVVVLAGFVVAGAWAVVAFADFRFVVVALPPDNAVESACVAAGGNVCAAGSVSAGGNVSAAGSVGAAANVSAGDAASDGDVCERSVAMPEPVIPSLEIGAVSTLATAASATAGWRTATAPGSPDVLTVAPVSGRRKMATGSNITKPITINPIRATNGSRVERFRFGPVMYRGSSSYISVLFMTCWAERIRPLGNQRVSSSPFARTRRAVLEKGEDDTL